MAGGGLDARRRERTIDALGIVLLVTLAACVVSGMWLKWAYRPTEAQAWTDITTLHTAVTWGQFVRNVHRWTAVFAVIGMFAYLVVCSLGFELVASRTRQGPWASALSAMAVAVVVAPVLARVGSSSGTPLRRWFVNQEAVGCIRLASVMFAVIVWWTRPRGVRAEGVRD